MPSRRTYRRTTRPTYRRRYARKSVASTAHHALALARKAQREKELKAFYLEGTFPVTEIGSLVPMSEIPQGDTSITREGLVIYPTSVAVKINLTKDDLAPTSQVRIVIFKFKAGTANTVQDYFPSSPQMFDFKSPNQQFESITLYDRVFSLSSNRPQVFTTIRASISGMITYGLSNEPTTNGIYMIVFSDITTNGPTIEYNSRLNFKDS